jgi:hypothetical protein
MKNGKGEGSTRTHKPIGESCFLVVGLVRNCEPWLVRDVERLRSALDKAKKLKWLLIESDSADGTLDVLKSLKENMSDFNFLSLGTLTERMPLRTERMAFCRNKYVDEIRYNEAYIDVDYVVVSDFDGVNTLISKATISSCWAREDWDICAANQSGPYYDVWALRHENWSPNDCWAQYKFFNKYDANFEKNLHASVYSRMITVPVNSNWIEVDSAFGGLAVYRRTAFDDSSYVGLADLGEEICEHVPFHKSLTRKGYRIFINPKMINAGYVNHSKQLLFVNRIRRKTKNLLKRFVKSTFGHSGFSALMRIMNKEMK